MKNPFENNAIKYDKWYDDNKNIYDSELAAVFYLFKKAKRKYAANNNFESSPNTKSENDLSEIITCCEENNALNKTKTDNDSYIHLNLDGLEVGVGSGRFGQAIGIKHGIDPSPSMLKIASERGMTVSEGIGEELPYRDNQFDYTAFFTSVCFIHDPLKAFREAYRVTKKGGFLLCSFLNRESPLGKMISANKKEDAYYKDATFYNGDEIIRMLSEAGYQSFSSRQTIFSLNGEKCQKNIKGLGYGLYGVILGWKT